MPRLFLFAAALFAGFGYCASDYVTAPAALHIVWKGAGVGLLALWGASIARSRDGWLLAAVMALGAIGDVLLEVAGLTVGAVAFLAGHLLAVLLYRRNPRERTSVSQRLLAASLLAATPLVSWLLTRDAGVALYATGLGAMVATAWLSRFPHGRTGVGALLFVVSDWLIFARGGALADSALPGLLIWPAYFAGQALIAQGVASTLERDA